MRLNLNLASQPYGDVRRFVRRWTAALIALTVLTCALAFAASVAIVSWRTEAREQRALQDRIAQFDHRRADVQAFLNQPENRTTRDRSQFVNELIARKSLSWTLVLAELERLMPRNLQVTSIAPKINDNNQLELEVSVFGTSRDGAIQLVRGLEHSRHFLYPRVTDETVVNQNTGQGPPSGQASGVQFKISAIYLPELGQENR